MTRGLPKGDLVNRLQSLGFPPSAIQATGFLSVTPAGLTPAEHTSLRWTHSRKVGFPDSGSDLGATPQSSAWEERSLSADSHPPPLNPVYFQGRSVVHRPYVLLVRLLLEPPSVQSPFARSRRYLARRGCLHHVRGRYPAVIATTGSCASPTPSHRLWSKPRSAGLCRLLSAPAGK